MATDVLIVIVSFNGLAETQSCVQSFQSQDKDVDLLIWDNNSTDGTPDWIMANHHLFAGIYLSPENVLWTPAVNKALKDGFEKGGGQQKYRYVGWMNNDISLVSSSTVSRLCEHLNQEKCGIIAPMMPRVGGPQEVNQYLGNPIPVDGWMNAPYVLGAFCLMRSEVWLEVGPLEESMPLGADDHDYSIRVREARYQCRVARDVWVDHGGHASARTQIGAKNWHDWGGPSWDAFNKKWENYYASEEEAIKCHWGGVYHPGWDIGTGWMSEEDRKNIEDVRERLGT